MMPMTPIGTRILATSMPVGRLTRSEICPTGSASCATCSTPWAICSMSFGVSVSRSMNAASAPLACATSALLAARISFALDLMSLAMAPRARFFASASARASARAAARAARPSSRTACLTSSF
jgi:hypothetical protein